MHQNLQKPTENLTIKLKRILHVLPRFLPLLCFLVPMIILYCIYPDSFEKTWKGRTYYIFFLWLLTLEMILNWEETHTTKLRRIRSPRTIAFAISLLIPMIYVIIANFYGLNSLIQNYASQNLKMADYFASNMPVCIEYLIFAALFILIVLLQYGTIGLKYYSIAPFLLAIIGSIYMIDNFYPEGAFTPFQMIVPTTVTLAASVLNIMGYQTRLLAPYKGMPRLLVGDSEGRYSIPFAIAWPCSGIDSLLLYTVTVLLFLKKSPITTLHKVIYFVIGAVVTYFINVLRIVTIFIISVNGGNWNIFHDLYGPLYSVTWIVSYPLIIIGIEAALVKIKNRKLAQKAVPDKLETNFASAT
ncbi:MAG: exosortase/archaeosortase family protein [Candidatus Bathycorpusculaceae bacterium]